MDKNKARKSTQTPANKRQSTPGGSSYSANRTNSNKSSEKCPNVRSKSTLSRNDVSQNITFGRKDSNGSMPNLNASGSRNNKIDKTTRLRFAYDEYLSSLEAKYIFQLNEEKINSNINQQKKVFMGEFDMLRKQMLSLIDKLKSINSLKIEKNSLDKKTEVIETLYKNVEVSKPDEKIMSLFTNTVSKIVVKNYKKMDENDLNTVKTLLSEIIEPLKLLDYENKISARIQLKDLLIKLVMLTNELDKYKVKAEELFDKQEHMQNYSSAIKISKDQLEENQDMTLLVNNINIMEDIQQVLDEI
ncbi:Hypothetical protein CINCED_3A015347 [Cinara cedri]|uniref:Uncharacterized protein n=1 Tax=Cinara cedri TaxID=506608 RepID=A0A5E4N6N0_9HEMI|nr:Hypothetical protein CINCED_3A015347 [Cinara cedri]